MKEYNKNMSIKDIYKKYQCPLNLQQHMLRVASLASVILDSWQGEINSNALIQACLFHDIAKPMFFDLAKQTQYGMPTEEIEKLANLQAHLKASYQNEHQATVGICREIGLNDAAVHVVDNLEWTYIPKLLVENDIESLIGIYCDMRMGPNGILTLEERVKDLQKRNYHEDFNAHLKNGKLIEQKIKESISIDLNLIKDTKLDMQINDLMNVSFL